MAQQFPYHPAGNGLPPIPPMLPNMTGMGPGLTPPGGMPAMDPRLLQQMQQAMAQNPSGMDSVMLEMAQAMIPSPMGMLGGVLFGVGTSAALKKFIDGGKLETFARWGDKTANRIPGVGTLNQKFDKVVLPRIEKTGSDYLKQLFMRISPQDIEKNLIQHQLKALQTTWLERAALRLDGWFGTKGFNSLAQRILTPMKNSSIAWIKSRATGKLDEAYVNRLLKHSTVEAVHGEIDLISKELSGGNKLGSFLFNRNYKRLQGLRKSLQGLKTFYLNGYDQQYKILQILEKKGTQEAAGPIGRLVANTMHHLGRIFGGEFMGITGKTAAQEGGFMNKILGPGIAGMMTFGIAVSEAQKAETGDKTKTFFHNFLGMGIASMIGLEVGHKVLRPLVTKGLSVMATWQLPSLLRVIPMLGKMTWVGFAAEMVGMMVLSQPFQHVGEWISNKIFGKPKSVMKQEAKDAQEAAQQKQAEQQRPTNAMAPMPQIPGTGAMPAGDPQVFQPFRQDRTVRPMPVQPASAMPAPLPASHFGNFSITPEEIRNEAPAYEQDQQIQEQFTHALGDGHVEPGQLFTNPFGSYGVPGH